MMPATPLWLAALALATALLLRLRIAADLSPAQQRLRVTVGGTGAAVDLTARVVHPLLLGLPIATFELGTAPSGSQTSRRRRRFEGLLSAMLHSTPALGRFLRGLWRASAIERLEVDLEGGFADPALTGRAYGAYCALAAAAPAAVAHLRWQACWQGEPWRGTLRIGIHISVAELTWQVGLLIVRLPKTQWLRVARSGARGEAHVQ